MRFRTLRTGGGRRFYIFHVGDGANLPLPYDNLWTQNKAKMLFFSRFGSPGDAQWFFMSERGNPVSRRGSEVFRAILSSVIL